ncbi:MAG TPA: response regulator [Marinilabiliaceae bacterium]|nr:response regulator [Marinilabiliaceae bacterium]
MPIRILNKFINLFISGQDDKADMDTRVKSLLLNFSCITFIIIVLIEAFISLIVDKVELAVPFLTLSVLLIFSYFYLRSYTTIFHQKLLLSILLTTLVVLSITGGYLGIGGVWSVFFPFYATALRGRRGGAIWSAALLVTTLSLFLILQNTSLYYQHYPLSNIVFFSSLFVVAFITAFAFQFIRSEVLLEKDRIILDTQNQNNALEDMLTRLSHQIRTPLSNITGIIDIMGTTELSNEQKEFTNMLKKSSANLTEVVNDLVMATKTEIIQNSLTATTFNLYNTINSVFLLLLSENKKLKYSISLAPDIPYQITGNSIKIKQILLNLINSINTHSNSTHNHFILEVSRANCMLGKVILNFKLISNFIFPDLKDQHSDNFFNHQDLVKLNTGKIINFLKLGLTQKMIEVEGHNLCITPTQKQTIFEFKAPFIAARQQMENQQISTNKFQNKLVRKVSKEIKDAHVLIVEDNISNQQILNLYIRNHVKKIEVANNGKEALGKMALAKFDLVLMDVQMPIMDGFKATQKIRALEQNSNTHIPIIAVTANAFPEDKERCISAGMDDYISKPFDPEELIKKIKALLQNED